jgi:hypothetical protein
MHRHFAQGGQVEPERPPPRLYAIVDHTEPSVVGDGPRAHFSLDAIDADALDNMPRFGSINSAESAVAWRDYWRTRASMPGSSAGPMEFGVGDPFNQLRLYRIDALVERSDPAFATLTELRRPEEKSGSSESRPTWLEIKVGANQKIPAEVYPRMFGGPIAARINIGPPSAQRAASLEATFTLAHLPHGSDVDVQRLLGVGTADALAVYDVGQGSAAALTDERFIPRLYFDLGCGVYRNVKTCPPALSYCFTERPPIVLSHWDADHWAGAYWQDPRGSLPALGMNWIAPHQYVSPIHLAFANDILNAGGKMLICNPSAGNVSTYTITGGHTLALVRCNGSDRNDSGFATCITEHSHPDRKWLLTGDAAYDYILPHLPGGEQQPFQAVIVPHHGAELSHQRTVPRPLSADPKYQRLVFSFGPNNAHGRASTSHPKQVTVDAHEKAGWDVGVWNGVAAPGHRVAGADVRATGQNGPGCERLHSILINWNGDLTAPQIAPCGGKLCSHKLTQI